jgi:5-oxoprolinase (ATP-hydrolysing) subunit A
MGLQIDLNCDMGESFGNYVLGQDAEILNYVSSANIACGFHAGDPLVMAKTVQLALEKGVAVGAHPAYPDLQGFGRRKMDLTPAEIEALIIYQIGALDGFVRASGGHLSHVKAHGALYNVAAQEPAVARAYARAVARYNPQLSFVCLATAPMIIEEGQKAGLRVVREAFADRAYNADGSLVSRRLAGSLLTDPQQAADQVVRLVRQGEVAAIDGTVLKLQADTVCLHGDGPTAPAIARVLKERLQQEGIQISAPHREGQLT